jgi:competence transcription factor ComK
MIEYIINDFEGSLIYQNHDIITKSKQSSLAYIKQLCIKHYFTYQGYLEAIKKELGYCYKIPIYMSEQNMFFQTQRARDYDNIWINFFAIESVQKKENTLLIIFKSQRKLQISLTLKQFEKQKAQLEFIRNQKVKHFHCHSCGKSLEIVL